MNIKCTHKCIEIHILCIYLEKPSNSYGFIPKYNYAHVAKIPQKKNPSQICVTGLERWRVILNVARARSRNSSQCADVHMLWFRACIRSGNTQRPCFRLGRSPVRIRNWKSAPSLIVRVYHFTSEWFPNNLFEFECF